MKYIKSEAEFSPDKKYRYALWRIWDDSKQKVLFICLNPSTADALKDDPTIRRCVGFADNWGYGGLYIANLFAFRATNPRDMKKQNYPIGPKNDDWILQMVGLCNITIISWGTHGNYLSRGRKIIDLLKPSQIYCLEKTKDGYPKHPLYLKKDLKPLPFEF